MSVLITLCIMMHDFGATASLPAPRVEVWQEPAMGTALGVMPTPRLHGLDIGGVMKGRVHPSAA